MAMSEVECPNCGKYKKSLGTHWNLAKDCYYPDMTQLQLDTVTGLMLSDGTLTRNYKNPVLQVKMVNREYLEHLSDLFGAIGLEVKLHKTSYEQAEMNRNSGFHTNARGDNYQDVYRWMTRAHPDLNRFRGWYTDDGKVFPDNVTISPQLLKTWYAGDGDLQDGSRVRLASATQNMRKITSYFADSGIPEPNFSGHKVYWSTEDSKTVFEYMGAAPLGFEYKWPDQNA